MGRASRCANSSCSAVCHHDEGKFFRLDIDVGDRTGGSQCKTIYVWLCPRCALQMNPKIEVVGDTVSVRLAAIKPARVHARWPQSTSVN